MGAEQINQANRKAVIDRILRESKTDAALQEVKQERARQDAKHGGPEHDDQHGQGDWVGILYRLVCEANPPGPLDLAQFRKQMIQVGATAVAAVESFDRLYPEVAPLAWEGSGESELSKFLDAIAIPLDLPQAPGLDRRAVIEAAAALKEEVNGLYETKGNLGKALAFYADPESWKPKGHPPIDIDLTPVYQDSGSKARAALKEAEAQA